jgi:uracil-DNA glycosylase
MDLEKIRKDVVVCTKCSLCKTRTNAVPGRGNLKSDIVFVGEAPGKTEDERGEPFVGAAGKKLTDALEKSGMSRDSVYITNVVKCRPPGNRVPTEEERTTCIKYLEMELEAIAPKMVCILGNTASNSVLGQADITKNRGKVIEKGGRKYFLTFHPAAIIYNQKIAKIFEDDIATLAKIVRGM